MRPDEPRKCELCDERFANVWKCSAHKRRVHPGAATKRNGKAAERPPPAPQDTPPPAPRRSGLWLSYCPCCGADLKLIRAALQAAEVM